MCDSVPSIAQLVERRTVVQLTGILRSLVQVRLEGEPFNKVSWKYQCFFSSKKKNRWRPNRRNYQTLLKCVVNDGVRWNLIFFFFLRSTQSKRKKKTNNEWYKFLKWPPSSQIWSMDALIFPYSPQLYKLSKQRVLRHTHKKLHVAAVWLSQHVVGF